MNSFSCFFLNQKLIYQGLLVGGPAVKNPPSKAGDTSSIPGQQAGPTCPEATEPSLQLLGPHSPEPEHCGEDPAQLTSKIKFSKNNVLVLSVGYCRAKNFNRLIPDKLGILFSTLSNLGRGVVNVGGKQC